MPKHIRQGIKGTLFSVSVREDVFCTFRQRAALWIMVKVKAERAFLHPGPLPVTVNSWERDCQAREEHTPRTQKKKNYPQPLDEKDKTWENQQKSCPICLGGTHMSQRVCGGQRTASWSQSLPSSVWGQTLNSGCQAWQQVPSPTKPSLRPINTNSKCVFTDENHRGMWRCWWRPKVVSWSVLPLSEQCWDSCWTQWLCLWSRNGILCLHALPNSYITRWGLHGEN